MFGRCHPMIPTTRLDEQRRFNATVRRGWLGLMGLPLESVAPTAVFAGPAAV